ncbi:MAG: hypothetical protein ACRDJ4_07590 [Actinomycetota bacterium]
MTSIERRLDEVAERIARAGEEMAVAGEQVAFQTDVAEEARVRMLVSETPLSVREHREASGDLERLQEHHARCLRHLEDLRRERDRLLDEMLERGR